MKTYSLKPAAINRKWYLLDAGQLSVGRLATVAAQLLLGKGKPQFSQHIDCGDFVVVINASNLKVTGNKLSQKMYYHHSHYPGGLKATSLAEQLKKDPNKVIIQAVRGMLPDNKLRDARLKRLKVYSGAEHNHSAQQPEALNLGRKK